MVLCMDMAKVLLGRLVGAALATGLLFTLTGCREGGADGAAEGKAVVIAPGGPGEEARTISPSRPPGSCPTTARTRPTGRTCGT